jgi:hypothetical protein
MVPSVAKSITDTNKRGGLTVSFEGYIATIPPPDKKAGQIIF